MATITEPSTPSTLTYDCILKKGDTQYTIQGSVDDSTQSFNQCVKTFISFLAENLKVVAPDKQYYISKDDLSPDLPSPYSHSNTLDYVMRCAFSQLIYSKDASVVLDVNIIPVTHADFEAMFISHMNGKDNSITITIAKVELPAEE